MGQYGGPRIVTSGLLVVLDAANIVSYPGSGTAIKDLVFSADGTINGTITFSSVGSSSYWNFATASSANYISSTVSQAYLDCTIVFQPDFTVSNSASLVGLIAASNDTTNTDKSMRFGGATSPGPWTVRSSGLNADDWGNASTTYYVNGAAVADGASLNAGWNILGAYRTNQTTFPASFAYFMGTEGFSGGVRDFQGRIAAVYLYNRQLTAAEHATNYHALKGRYGLK
jgi:hypothetical protein